MYHLRTSCVKPKLERFRLKEKVRNVLLHAGHNHLCCALSIQRWVSDSELVIIPGKINIIPPQVLPERGGRDITPGTFALEKPEEGLEK